MRWVALLPFAGFAGLWWLLSGGDASSWIIGIPSVLAAGWTLQQNWSSRTVKFDVLGLVYFVPFFLWESLRGGVDVASRTLAPRLRVAPGFYRYRTQLGRREARLLFTNCVSLLPGTLAADLRDDCLEVHLLDVSTDPTRELQGLERAVGRVFRDPLATGGPIQHA